MDDIDISAGSFDISLSEYICKYSLYLFFIYISVPLSSSFKNNSFGFFFEIFSFNLLINVKISAKNFLNKKTLFSSFLFNLISKLSSNKLSISFDK